MRSFSFFKKEKKSKESDKNAKCSFVIFTDKTSVKKGEDISFTIGICNKSSSDMEIGLSECFIDYDSSQMDYKGFDDKIGGTKITFPSKRNSAWNARMSRLGRGLVVPAMSTYVFGVFFLSTEETERLGEYKIQLSECVLCSYEGFAMSIPSESNSIVFTIE